MNEVIDTIPDTSTTDSMTFELTGQAYQIVLQLRKSMRDVNSEKDVIIKAIALLNRAKGKEVQIIAPKSGEIEIVSLWK